MSKQKRSRALLRNLRKQARKGTLSAREKQQLASQEKKFRKARRSTAKGVGAGLAGAAALLSTTAGQQLMSGAKDAMGRASDRRMDRRVARADERSKKEAEKLEELARQREEETGVRMAEGADRAEEAEREEDRQNLLKRAEAAEKREKEEAQDKLRADVDKAVKENPALAALLGRSDSPMGFEQAPASSIRPVSPGPKYDEGEGTAFVDLPKSTAPMFDAPVGPINEPAFSVDDLMMPASEAGPRAEEMPDPNRPVMTRQGMDLATMIAMQGEVPEEYRGVFESMDDRERAQMAREAARQRAESRRQGESGVPLASQAGPRVQEDGGKVEYGIGGAILGGINALRSGQGLGGAALAATKGFVTPGSGFAQVGKLAGGLLAGSKNPSLAKFGQIAQAGSNFLPGGGGVMSFLPQAAGLFSGEQGMKVQEMRQGGRAADLKKMIAKKYGFR